MIFWFSFCKVDAQRRKHLYDEFILTYLKILAETGKLAEVLQNGNGSFLTTARRSKASKKSIKNNNSNAATNAPSSRASSSHQLTKRVRRK